MNGSMFFSSTLIAITSFFASPLTEGCNRDCDQELCDLVKDMQDFAAVRGELCCQQAEIGGEEALSECIESFTDVADSFFLLMTAARASSQNSNFEQFDEVIDDIRELIKDGLHGSAIAYGSGEPGNVLVPFAEPLTLKISMNAPASTPTTAQTATLVVNQTDHLPEAAEDAVQWKAQELSGSPGRLFLDPLLIDHTITIPTATNRISTTKQVWTGSITASGSWTPGPVAVNLNTIVVGSSFPVATASGQWCLPTELELSGSVLGYQVSVTLDKTNPRNTVELDGQGKGYLMGAVHLDLGAHSIGARARAYGPFWMTLPVRWNAQDQCLELDTSNPISTNDLFPRHELVPANPIPGEGVSPVLCGDPDGNGHPYLYDNWGSLFETWRINNGCTANEGN
ncbi:MAG: hypothetical protein ACF8MJ_13940 [Phycisphaerales bacterium JB050]